MQFRMSDFDDATMREMLRKEAHGPVGEAAVRASVAINRAVADAKLRQSRGDPTAQPEQLRGQALLAATEGLQEVKGAEIDRLVKVEAENRGKWEKARGLSALQRAAVMADTDRRLAAATNAELIGMANDFAGSDGPGDLDFLDALSIQLRDRGEGVD